MRVGSDNQTLRLNRHTYDRVIAGDISSNSSLSSLSPSVFEPNYDSGGVSSPTVCRNNAVSFSDLSNINYWVHFSR